jgi:hypothetical protein
MFNIHKVIYNIYNSNYIDINIDTDTDIVSYIVSICYQLRKWLYKCLYKKSQLILTILSCCFIYFRIN